MEEYGFAPIRRVSSRELEPHLTPARIDSSPSSNDHGNPHAV